jgi:hypothetical protein
MPEPDFFDTKKRIAASRKCKTQGYNLVLLNQHLTFVYTACE